MLLSYSPNNQQVMRYKFSYNFRYINYFVTNCGRIIFALHNKK